MKKQFITFLAVLMVFYTAPPVYAGDVEVMLTTADGSTEFEVKDSAAAVVFEIDSDGNFIWPNALGNNISNLAIPSTAANPNGVVTAAEGSITFDTVNNVMYVNTDGGTTWVAVATGSGSNIYTTDDSLTANRTVTMAGNSLTFDGTGDIAFSDAGEITLTPGQGLDTNAAGDLDIAQTTATAVNIGSGALTDLTVITDGTGTSEVVLPADSIDSTEILDNTITATDLAATLTFADADLIDLSAIDSSGVGEGLILPQDTDVSAATAEGQISWDSDSDSLVVGTGGGQVTLGTGTGDVTDVGNCSGPACFTGASGNTLTSTTSEIIDLSADAVFEFQRNDAGAVTFLGADDAGAADTIYDTTGAGAITVGSADVTSVTVTTDGTGTGEVVLPNDSVDTLEILDNTITATDLAATVTFADADLFDFSSINPTTTTEGILLPQATDVSAATAEGQITWDTDNDQLVIGTGGGQVTVSTGIDSLDSAYDDDGGSGAGRIITVDSGDVQLNLEADDGLLINENNGTAITNAINITSTGGGAITDAIDASAALITNAINIGANNIEGTNFDVNGGTGEITVAVGQGLDTNAAGDLDIAQATATAVNIGSGALTDLTVITDGTGTSEVVLPNDSIDTNEILDNTITATDLAATLTFADADLIDFSAINSSGVGEGLILPQDTDVSAATAEGQISWDSDSDSLVVGTGGGQITLGTGTGDVTDVGNCSGPACFTGVSGNTLTSTTAEIIDLSTDAVFEFQRNDAGAVTFLGADDAGAADTIYDTTGAGAITVGSADVTSVTVTTDGTGTGEVVLPNDSVDTLEILDNTITATDLASTITFADADLIDYSSINPTSTTEGILLPQATDVSAATAEGQITWDTDNDQLVIGTGGGQVTVSTGIDSLDSAYDDDGGAGAGRIITVDSGDVQLNLEADDGLLINENNGTAITDALNITSTGGGAITDAIDASAALITNAINIGANNIEGTNFDVNGGTGEITVAVGQGLDTNAAGDLDIAQATATAVNIGSGVLTDLTVITDGTGTSEVVLPNDSIDTNEILDNTITATDIAATVTFADADLFDFSSVNPTTTTEGILLPQATDVSAATAEGQITWDTDGDTLFIGTGGGQVALGTGTGDVTDVGNCSGPTCFTGVSGNTLTSTTSEIIDLSTDAVFEFQRNDAGAVTFLGADDAGAADTIYDTTGAGAITVGSADVTSVTVTTDGTGTGEVVLPNDSVDTNEILDDTITATDLAATLTFADADLIDLSAINSSGVGEGLILPQDTDVSAATAEGQISWDSDSDSLVVGTGGGQITLGTGTGDVTDVGNCSGPACFTGASGNTLTSTTSEVIDLSADAIFEFQRNDAGAVTFLGADDAGAADTIYDTTGAGAITVGSADVTAITLTTDGTGTAEVVLPNDSVDTNEILDNTITATDLASTITFADADLIDYSSINPTSTTEGILLPQATDVSAATAEGQITWDTDNDQLVIGTGGGQVTVSTGIDSLDSAYDDDGGSGAGRIITVDSGDVQLNLEADDGLLINENNGTAITNAINITSTGGGAITDAIDASAALITNAINIGANNIEGTNFDVNGGTGEITVAAGQGLDTNAAGALDIAQATATSVNIGSGANTALTVTTDGTGTAEVVLPADSIDGTEILDDTLDFADFSDTMTVDAATSVTMGANSLTFASNAAGDFLVTDGTDNYIRIDPALDVATAEIEIGNAADNPDLLFLGTGDVSFETASTFQIPSDAAPTLTAEAQIALDNNVSAELNDLLVYQDDGASDFYVIAMPEANLPGGAGDDGKILAYDDATNTFEFITPGGSSEWTDTGTILHPNEPTADEIVLGDTTEANADIFLGADGVAVFNEQGNDSDFRIEGDNQANLFVVDASVDSVGIGTATPAGQFEVEVADTENLTGIIVDQDDTTNNPTALEVQNAGTGNGLFVNQDGNGSAISIDSESTSAVVLDIPSPASTTGNVISVAGANSLTTGSVALFASDSADASARNLVNIVNDNAAATGAIPLRVQQDSTNEAVQIRAAEDQEFIQLFDTTNTDTTSLYTGTGSPDTVITAQAGSLYLDQTGSAYINTDGVTSWSQVATGSGGVDNLDEVYAESVTDTDVNMEIDNALGLQFDLTTTGDFQVEDNGTAFASFLNDGTIVFNDGSTATGDFSVEGDNVTDALFVDVSADSVGIGTATPGAQLETEVADTENRVGLIVDQDDTTNNLNAAEFQNAGTGIGVFIDQDGNGQSLNIDSEATTANVVDIAGATSTTGNILNITGANALTTGGVALLASDSADTGTRDVVSIVNDNAAATGATALNVQQDSTGDAIDITSTTGDAINVTGTTGIVLDATKTAAGQWFDFNDGTDNFGVYNNPGTPEGVVAADIGSIATDTTNGSIYVKTTDTVNTGWTVLSTGNNNFDEVYAESITDGDLNMEVDNASGLTFELTAGDFNINMSGTNDFVIQDAGANQHVFADDGSVVLNEAGVDADVIIEGDNDANLLTTDAGNDRVGVSQASPRTTFDVDGTVAMLNGTSGVATMTVTDGVMVLTGSTALTDIVDGVIGQVVWLVGGAGADVTVTDGNNISLDRDINFTVSEGDMLHLMHDGSVWREIKRSNN